jgi:hypothetical protein
MLNPFFLQGAKQEQGLLQDLINESIKIHGVDIYYLPRLYVTKRKVIREVIESKFTTAFPLEAYIASYDGYEGAGTLLSKFGIKPENDLNLIISRERYSSYITPLIQNIPDIELPTRPKEGDLIWFPLGDRLFEIKYVEHELPFYQLQENYVYELRCELFRYQDELIDTGYDFIDDNTQNQGYNEFYRMIGVGSTATAITSVVNGGVVEVIVTNRGRGYNSPPDVGFSTSPGLTATGSANMIGGIVDLCEPNENSLRVQSVDIVNPGFGYTIAPIVAFYNGGGTGAEAFARIGDGVLGVITVTSGGSGYSSVPNVTIVGIANTTPIIKAELENGSVSRIVIVKSGIGFTEIPQIMISDPTFIGVGTYQFNELVTGNVTGNTARVKKWNSVDNILELSNTTGSFVNGELITGEVSNAQYKIQVGINTLTQNDANDLNIKLDPFLQNNDIQIEANKIIDETEYNIFGRI